MTADLPRCQHENPLLASRERKESNCSEATGLAGREIVNCQVVHKRTEELTNLRLFERVLINGVLIRRYVPLHEIVHTHRLSDLTDITIQPAENLISHQGPGRLGVLCFSR